MASHNLSYVINSKHTAGVLYPAFYIKPGNGCNTDKFKYSNHKMQYGFNPFKKGQMKKDVMKDHTCPMHKEVVSNMAGTCAKYGKGLVTVDRKSSKQGLTVYTCSMHLKEEADKQENVLYAVWQWEKKGTKQTIKK